MTINEETLSDKIEEYIRKSDVREFIRELKEELGKDKYSYTFECRVIKAIDKLAGKELK